MHSVRTRQLAQHQHLELQKSSFSRVPVPKGLMIKPDQNRCDLKSTKLQFNNPFSRYWFQPTWLNLELVKVGKSNLRMKRQRIWNHHLAIIPQHHCLLTPFCGQKSTYNFLALFFFSILLLFFPYGSIRSILLPSVNGAHLLRARWEVHWGLLCVVALWSLGSSPQQTFFLQKIQSAKTTWI